MGLNFKEISQHFLTFKVKDFAFSAPEKGNDLSRRDTHTAPAGAVYITKLINVFLNIQCESD